MVGYVENVKSILETVKSLFLTQGCILYFTAFTCASLAGSERLHHGVWVEENSRQNKCSCVAFAWLRSLH